MRSGEPPTLHYNHRENEIEIEQGQRRCPITKAEGREKLPPNTQKTYRYRQIYTPKESTKVKTCSVQKKRK